MLVLSLFPGADLLGMAFEQEGFTVVQGPDVIFGRDIRTFHVPPGRFDGVIGGPPCQAFSALVHLVRANGYEPRFGNLIPEFERVVAEAAPAWCLMENVRAAPVPAVPGYGIHDFEWDNGWVPGGDGVGEAQNRRRRFSFGRRGAAGADLRRWLRPAALEAMERVRTVAQHGVNNTAAAKGRVKAPALAGDLRPVPVRLGGSGKVKVTAVTGSDGGASKRMTRYRLADACELQGLPRDFLADAPFRADAKLQLVANGVPVPLGRAIARAVKAAVAEVPA